MESLKKFRDSEDAFIRRAVGHMLARAALAILGTPADREAWVLGLPAYPVAKVLHFPETGAVFFMLDYHGIDDSQPLA